MSAPPDKIRELVETFERNLDHYKDGKYNETQLRIEFLDPFFTALGWDINNKQGYAEAYKDVIHEDAIKIGGTTKAPDYCFRIGGARKFFVEAKKPSVNIERDVSPAFQLRRYAWTAKLPLSILTDFEEFAVYDCLTKKPKKTDKASTARIHYYTFRDYAEKWEEIHDVFARESILKGSFDKYAASHKKRGTTEVDAEFLKEIEAWREALAKNLALRNPELGTRDLNYAVQKTIDRIIFLRICEDRGIERPNQLRALQNGGQVYRRMTEMFERADERYNSGLFHFHEEKGRAEPPDQFTLELNIDDKVLKEIVGNLYYPESPYEFSVFSADILGQVYEQFLGKVIRLTAGHQAKIEEKPEVKKAGGVYYTPTYIVDYIVKETIGKLVEGKTPQEVGGLTQTWKPSKAKGVRPLKVLDPACGSGSFLIGAYQFLLDWYRDWYTADGPEKHKDRIYQSAGGEWKLTTTERKRILLDHIYGVDIDPQAVEVTKLSLLLKVLEGENEQSIDAQMRFFKERALPDLSSNIKCGNSLIGSDFYKGKQLALFDEEEQMRINAFDWEVEFKDIMQTGGFDAVIGNPPYVRMEMFKEIKDYLREHYKSHAERTDLYVYFIEKEHRLLRDGGLFGMIVSNKFIRAKYGEPVRKILDSVARIRRIVDLAGLPVFKGATVRTVVLISEKARTDKEYSVIYSPPPDKDDLEMVEGGSRSLDGIAEPITYAISNREVGQNGWRLIRPEVANLMDRLLTQGESLKQFSDNRICRGIVSGLTDAFVISEQIKQEITSKNPEAEEIIHPYLQGRQIRRYRIEESTQYMIYTHHGVDMKPYPAVLEHLLPYRARLEKRATKQKWYELQQPQYAYFKFLIEPKIVFPDISTECRFALDRSGHFGANTVYFVPMEDYALLGLLNSKLSFFFFKQICAALEGPGESYMRFFGQYLEGFPVKLEGESRAKLASLAEHFEKQVSKLSSSNTAHQKTLLERQIESTDREIDRLVYQLYGLTDAEIKIVEEATQ